METIKKQLEKILSDYGFKKTDKSDGLSIMYNCHFYETQYKDIYITDYDFRNNEDLKEKNMIMIFSRRKENRKYQLISVELLTETKWLNHVLKEFAK